MLSSSSERWTHATRYTTPSWPDLSDGDLEGTSEESVRRKAAEAFAGVKPRGNLGQVETRCGATRQNGRMYLLTTHSATRQHGAEPYLAAVKHETLGRRFMDRHRGARSLGLRGVRGRGSGSGSVDGEVQSICREEGRTHSAWSVGSCR